MKEAEISVEEYVSKYVRPEEFLQYCRECPNYGHKWSCPEYDFDTREYFRRYRNLKVFGLKILYDEDLCRKELTREEMRKILSESMMVERKKLDSMLREGRMPGPPDDARCPGVPRRRHHLNDKGSSRYRSDLGFERASSRVLHAGCRTSVQLGPKTPQGVFFTALRRLTTVHD